MDNTTGSGDGDGAVRRRAPVSSTTSIAAPPRVIADVISTNVNGETAFASRRFAPSFHDYHFSDASESPCSRANFEAVLPLAFHRATRFDHISRVAAIASRRTRLRCALHDVVGRTDTKELLGAHGELGTLRIGDLELVVWDDGSAAWFVVSTGDWLAVADVGEA